MYLGDISDGEFGLVHAWVGETLLLSYLRKSPDAAGNLETKSPMSKGK